MISLSR